MSEPTRRFSDRVADYFRFRPRYPRGLVPLLRERIGLDRMWTVADIGSGTGFSAEPFLEHGNAVVGVEPNAAMRAAAEAVLAGWPAFTGVDGTAEATGLPAQSIDLITCGQAFHWFDVARARVEFLRVLRPGGWTVVFWNTRRTDSTPFLRDYEELLLRHGTDYQTVRHDRLRARGLDALFTGGYERHALAYEQRLDEDAFVGRLLSSSYVPGAGDPRREVMLRDAADVFAQHQQGGRVEIAYDTEIYVGKL